MYVCCTAAQGIQSGLHSRSYVKLLGHDTSIVQIRIWGFGKVFGGGTTFVCSTRGLPMNLTSFRLMCHIALPITEVRKWESGLHIREICIYLKCGFCNRVILWIFKWRAFKYKLKCWTAHYLSITGFCFNRFVHSAEKIMTFFRSKF
jgi:hypothetical protein